MSIWLVTIGLAAITIWGFSKAIPKLRKHWGHNANKR